MTAIKRNTNVVFLVDDVACPAPPNIMPVPGGSYTIFIDDGNGGGTAADDILSTGELILKSVSMPVDVALCSTDFTGKLISFLPTGLPKNGNTGKIVLNSNSLRESEVSVNISGYIKNN
jgi:type IV fimbrial biogenesis protein FimT